MLLSAGHFGDAEVLPVPRQSFGEACFLPVISVLGVQVARRLQGTLPVRAWLRTADLDQESRVAQARLVNKTCDLRLRASSLMSFQVIREV